MPKKQWDLSLKTPTEELNKDEALKIHSNGMRGDIGKELRDDSAQNLSSDAEKLAKSHGIYLEFNRAKTGAEKDWFYMIRLSNPGGGPVNAKQWKLIDELADKYGKDPEGNPSIRLTTRQAIQFHWVSKQGVLDIVKTMAENDLRSLNGCGDNIRNVTGCPYSFRGGIFDATAIAQKCGDYFQLPLEPFCEVFAIDPNFVRTPEESFDYGKQLLNKKCKIAIGGAFIDQETQEVVMDNSIEIRINEMGVAPVITDKKLTAFQIYLGGGQGERNGKPSLSTLGKPFCQVDTQNLLPLLDAIVSVHKEWSDRKDRQFARMKYTVKKQGLDWYRDRVLEKIDFPLLPADENHDIGDRKLHHGWRKQANGKWCYGLWIENGRLRDDSPNGKMKSLVRTIMDTFQVQMMVTANQDVLFLDIPEEKKQILEDILTDHNYGTRNGKEYSTLRKCSGSCVGLPTCRLSYTDSERFEPELIDALEEKGWGDLKEAIGVTGCERQCFRPATKSIGLVGAGMNLYQLKLGGSENARHQGGALVDPRDELMYLRFIPRAKVATVLDTFLHFYTTEKQPNEDIGTFVRRIGIPVILDHFRDHPETKDLMKTALPSDCVIEA